MPVEACEMVIKLIVLHLEDSELYTKAGSATDLWTLK